MSFVRSLALSNLKRRPGRTAAMMLLAAFLSCSVLAGSVVIGSMQNGLASYEARLGADIVAVPYEATTKATLESILLQGIPGYFYMDMKYCDKIRAIEGVETATPQFFLASATASCCSASVQIIGFDPETDISIQPWIRESYAGAVGEGDVIIGCNISMPLDGVLTFYDTPCRVVAQLDETGTGLDNAVYANMATIQRMMANAKALGFPYFDDLDTSRAVSSVMIRVADGYSIEEVAGDINIHVRHVKATQARSMISAIAGGLGGVARVIGLLTGMIWLLAIVILVIAYAMVANERRREFAVLRVSGASRKLLSRLLRTESVCISLAGAVLGAALACLVVLPFTGLIRQSLQLPYLLPSTGRIACMAAAAVAVSAAAGWCASVWAAARIGRSENALLLRESA